MKKVGTDRGAGGPRPRSRDLAEQRGPVTDRSEGNAEGVDGATVAGNPAVGRAQKKRRRSKADAQPEIHPGQMTIFDFLGEG